MKKNVASQKIGAQMITASDGSAFMGSVTVYVTGDAGTQAIGSVSSGACAHEGNGYHTYAPAQAETNYDLTAFTFIGTGAIPVTVQVFNAFPQTGDSFARVGAPAGASVSADIAAAKSDTAAVKAKTDNLPSDPADASVIAAAFVVTNGKIDAVDDYLDTELAAVKTVTDKLDDTLEDDAGTYRFTTNALEQAPSGGGGGSTDWTSDERTAIRSILGIPGSGTTPADPSTGILDSIRDKIDAVDNFIDTEVAAIKAKTDNLPSDPADASDISSSFSTVNSTLSTIAGYLDTEIAAIKAKTDNLPSDPADQSLLLAAISATWTTALTESYAANGVEFTAAQGLYAIHQFLMDHESTGTDRTIRKLDGSTEAFTATYNDATTPTGITR